MPFEVLLALEQSVNLFFQSFDLIFHIVVVVAHHGINEYGVQQAHSYNASHYQNKAQRRCCSRRSCAFLFLWLTSMLSLVLQWWQFLFFFLCQ